MSWASRRRFSYLFGVTLFFTVVFGVPFVLWVYESPSCLDGKQNQGETDTDKGGPCPVADVRTLMSPAVMWARSFAVREAVLQSGNGESGVYNTVAYIENPNDDVGVLRAPYRLKLYDEQNVLVAEREGVAFIMPGSVTPVFEGQIETGNRIVAHTFFEFSEELKWERLQNIGRFVEVGNKVLENTGTSPRGSARVTNTSVYALRDVVFVAVVFDSVGNAVTASQTAMPRIEAGEAANIVFSWPRPFGGRAVRLDVVPVVAPETVQ